MTWTNQGKVKLDSKGRISIKKFSDEASGFTVKTQPNGHILLVKLLESWKAGTTGKASTVPTKMPRPDTETTGTFKVRRVREISTSRDLLMAMRMDNGEIVVVNFKKDIIPYNKAFEVFKNPKVFMKAEAQGSGIRWEEEDIDIEVAELYDVAEPVNLKDLVS